MQPVLALDPANIPLALYIHVPWCVKKCPYCDFNSHALASDGVDEMFAQYVDALLKDAQSQQDLATNRAISSVFFGGGTPSLLPTAQMARLLDGLRALFAFTPDCEITLEANPGTLEHVPFAEYLAMGINRLSLGVQSFDEKALHALGRIHSPDNALTAIKAARAAGFKRVNVDLMHGLPAQTPELAVHDIKTAIDAGATHLSWYQLTIEPNTAFYRKPPDLPDESTLEAIETAGRACLYEHGFDDYEVSAWVSSNDKPCAHNVNYWQFGDYLAIGAGAHGKITLKNHAQHADGIYRFYKSRLPKDYVNFTDVSPNSQQDKIGVLHENIAHAAPKMVQFAAIDEAQLPFEFMMNALRLKHGVSTQLFEERTGLFVSSIDNELLPLQHQGFMVHDPTRLCPTPMGFRFVNHLVSAFLP
ncbi:YggW family oxidoreductase [Moraxella caviae]|uniref:Heme chaperone HemW n=1 Tax=Moraxella caviae TaxID=34060 RepID=A0A1T0A752_9GAMM|nr:radical SAM family heme chaperone HemW [Moraxella caviae]OOR91517.1 YggW family oxidoreductase [Moraxella caviae]STZ14396.1 Oxygen-independent coproporphyrinogen-III oxidase [Moraxella caviae]VEW10517.1 Oxygen-independent coproporphyrinogen-III oxidase [Moraxella caviae]